MCNPIKTTQEPWFTGDIGAWIMKRNAAHLRWRRFKTTELQRIFQALRREVVEIVENLNINSMKENFLHRFTIDLREKNSIRDTDVNIESHEQFIWSTVFAWHREHFQFSSINSINSKVIGVIGYKPKLLQFVTYLFNTIPQLILMDGSCPTSFPYPSKIMSID